MKSGVKTFVSCQKRHHNLVYNGTKWKGTQLCCSLQLRRVELK
jgi:hypothetical protein